MKSKKGYRIILVSFVFLLLSLFLDRHQLVSLILVKKLATLGLFQIIAFSFTYLGLTVSTIILFSVNNNIIRYSFAFLAFVSFSVYFSANIAHESNYGMVEASTAIEEISWAADAFKTYYAQYLLAIFISAFLVASFLFVSQKYLPKVNSYYSFFSLFFLIIAVAITIRTRAYVSPFPSTFNVPLITLYAFSNTPHFGPRDNPTIEYPDSARLVKHIFLIVDETVRGDLLSINNDTLSTTPYLKKISNEYYNYGIASSAAVASRASNMILQSGLRVDEIPDFNYKYASNANIFQYAKSAGYSTYFIDNQNETDRPQNNMSRYDFESIDHYIQTIRKFPTSARNEVDYKCIDDIVKIASSSEYTFTYLNKMGCHFPYQAYPSNKQIFQPAYKIGEQFLDIVKVLNTYFNVISWSVDGFFEKLLPQLEGEESLIIYISDHGESIMENGRFCGHCQEFPAVEQAITPFLVFNTGEKTKKLMANLDTNYVFNKNRLSHFQVFPTCLFLMGYNADAVREKYGFTIFDRLNGRRQFMSGLLYYPKYSHLNEFKLSNKK